jgi:sphingomyelin phosphodiesterase
VRAQFFGHTHNDEFIVFYDHETKSRPTNIGFVTPSVTTYTGMNPAFSIYTVDGPGEESSYVSFFKLNWFLLRTLL